MTTLHRPTCNEYVAKAVTYLCDTLAAGLSAEHARALWADSAVRAAEAAVDAAALAGDIDGTKAACRAWWLAALEALLTLAETDTTLTPRRAAWEKARAAIAAQQPAPHEGVSV